MVRDPFGFNFNPKKEIGLGNVYGNKSKPVRKAINKDLREKVWLKYMGNKVEGKCYCCKIKPMHFTDFEVGHNKAVSKGGKDHIENLRPICRSCNKGMGTKTIEWYRAKYYAKPIEKPKPVRSTPSKPKKPKTQQFNPFGEIKIKEPKLDWGI